MPSGEAMFLSASLGVWGPQAFERLQIFKPILTGIVESNAWLLSIYLNPGDEKDLGKAYLYVLAGYILSNNYQDVLGLV